MRESHSIDFPNVSLVPWSKRSALGSGRLYGTTQRNSGPVKGVSLSPMKKAHFSRDLFSFLEEPRSNNRREWFEPNRPRYERDVREPMRANPR
jgi:hypothetical protein